MTFFEDDQFLATCGIRLNTPILIYSVKNFNLLLSTYVNGFAIDLFVINNFIGEYNLNTAKKPRKKEKNLENMFIICTYTDIICFTYKDDHFITNEIDIAEHKVTSKIKCGTALRINMKNSSLMAHAEEGDKTTLIITGHKNGQVLIWEQLSLKSELANYKNEILNIGNSQLGVVIATDAATLHFVIFTFTFNFIFLFCFLVESLCQRNRTT